MKLSNEAFSFPCPGCGRECILDPDGAHPGTYRTTCMGAIFHPLPMCSRYEEMDTSAEGFIQFMREARHAIKQWMN